MATSRIRWKDSTVYQVLVLRWHIFVCLPPGVLMLGSASMYMSIASRIYGDGTRQRIRRRRGTGLKGGCRRTSGMRSTRYLSALVKLYVCQLAESVENVILLGRGCVRQRSRA